MAKRKADIASTLASEALAVAARRAAADGDDNKGEYNVDDDDDDDEDDDELAGMPPLWELNPAAVAAASGKAEASPIYTEEEFAKIACAIKTAAKCPILPVPKLYYFGMCLLALVYFSCFLLTWIFLCDMISFIYPVLDQSSHFFHSFSSPFALTFTLSLSLIVCIFASFAYMCFV